MSGNSPKATDCPLLAIGEAAKLCGVSVQTIRRWVAAGKLTMIRTPSGHRRIKRSELEAFL